MANDETTQEIQGIQENAISWLGRDPLHVRKHLQGEVTKSQKLSNNSTNAKSESIGIKERIKYLRLLVPEKLYGKDDQSILDRYENIPKTRYDRLPFLERFVNVEELCHEYFIKEIHADRLPIRLSSLPLTQVNGVSFYAHTGDRVVLLNEGLLYAVPELLKHSQNFLLLKDHYSMSQGASEYADAAEKFMVTLTNKHIVPFINMLTDILSGETLPFEMEYSGGSAYKPHADEKWAFMASLRADAFKDGTAKTLDRDRAKKHRFLAARGFFTLITGHEFSHFYRNHHEKRASGELLRSEAHCKEILEKIRKMTRNPSIPIDIVMSQEYLIAQPTEIEADADALRCVVKYCVDNGLEDDDLKHTVLGALSAYIYMELTERIVSISHDTLFNHDNIRTTPEDIRNVIFPTEHPCSLSRVPAALEHENWNGQYKIAKDYIIEMWEEMHLTLDWIWCMIVEGLYERLKQSDYKPSAQMNREHLFQGFSAVGCFDGQKSQIHK